MYYRGGLDRMLTRIAAIPDTEVTCTNGFRTKERIGGTQGLSPYPNFPRPTMTT